MLEDASSNLDSGLKEFTSDPTYQQFIDDIAELTKNTEKFKPFLEGLITGLNELKGARLTVGRRVLGIVNLHMRFLRQSIKTAEGRVIKYIVENGSSFLQWLATQKDKYPKLQYVEDIIKKSGKKIGAASAGLGLIASAVLYTKSEKERETAEQLQNFLNTIEIFGDPEDHTKSFEWLRGLKQLYNFDPVQFPEYIFFEEIETLDLNGLCQE